MSDHALFAVAPYLAMLTFAGVSLFRLTSSAAVRPLSQAPRRGRGWTLVWHSILTLACAIVLTGHVVLIAAPRVMLAWNLSPARLIGFEVVLFASGTIIAAALLLAFARPFREPVRDQGRSIADVACHGALVIAVVSGLGTAGLYRWASLWSTVTLTPYLRSLVAFEPDLGLVSTMPYFVKLHVFSGMVLVAIVPFTRWARVALTSVRRIILASLSPGARVVARRWRLLEAVLLERGRRLMWPDEEQEE